MNSNYKASERNIARLLSKIPLIKNTVKYVYSRFVFITNKKNHVHCTTFPIKAITKLQKETFFGYYDKSPVNSSGSLMLSYISSYPTTRKNQFKKVSIELGVFSLDDGEIILSLPTRAYNWQQGARAHWINDELFIYNDYDEESNRYISRVFSVMHKKEIKAFQLPVQDSFKTDFFLSLNYRRLQALRPDYGYSNVAQLTSAELKQTENDGIWLVNYATAEITLLYSLDDIIKCGNDIRFSEAYHKVNHIMISPSGEQFIFLHRYYVGKRKFDRLLLGDLTGNKLKILSDHEMVSHCFWADNDTILGYLRGPDSIDAYWLIDIYTGVFSKLPTSTLEKYGDGHPNVYKDWFVTDTYPDKARMQHLMLCNWKTGELRELGHFFHGFKYNGETRCDLHPRFSPDGKSIFFDSVYDGARRLYRMDLEL